MKYNVKLSKNGEPSLWGNMTGLSKDKTVENLLTFDTFRAKFTEEGLSHILSRVSEGETVALNLDAKTIMLITGQKESKPNTEWIETHHEIVSMLTLAYERDEKYALSIYDGGTGAAYELCESLADEFQKINEGREWDGDFFDEIEHFFSIRFKLKALNLEQ